MSVVTGENFPPLQRQIKIAEVETDGVAVCRKRLKLDSCHVYGPHFSTDIPFALNPIAMQYRTWPPKCHKTTSSSSKFSAGFVILQSHFICLARINETPKHFLLEILPISFIITSISSLYTEYNSKISRLISELEIYWTFKYSGLKVFEI